MGRRLGRKGGREGAAHFKESWCVVISVSVSQACVNSSSSRRAWKRRSMREDISGSGRPNCTQLQQHFIACEEEVKRGANKSLTGFMCVESRGVHQCVMETSSYIVLC